MKLGRSQQAVFSLLDSDKIPRTAQEIGDALYTKTSSCAKYGNGTGSMGGKALPEKIRRVWAQKLLNELIAKNLVTFTTRGRERIHSIHVCACIDE